VVERESQFASDVLDVFENQIFFTYIPGKAWISPAYLAGTSFISVGFFAIYTDAD